MAGGINVNGKIQRVPGIYGTYDATAIGGATPSVGNLGVVTPIPLFEQNKPYRFTNPQALKAVQPSNQSLAILADICWAPASDDRIGGVGSLTLVNPGACTLASMILNDMGPSPNVKESAILSSRLWGTAGNSVFYSLSNPTDQKKLNVTLSANGVTETYKNVGRGTVAQFSNANCAELKANNLVENDSSTISIGNDGNGDFCNHLQWSWTRHMWKTNGMFPIPSGETYSFAATNNRLLCNGKLSVTPLANGTGATSATWDLEITQSPSPGDYVAQLEVLVDGTTTVTATGTNDAETVSNFEAALLAALPSGAVVAFVPMAGLFHVQLESGTEYASGYLSNFVATTNVPTTLTTTVTQTQPGSAASSLTFTVTGIDTLGAARTATYSATGLSIIADQPVVLTDGAEEVVFARLDTMKWEGVAYTTAPALNGFAFDLTLDSVNMVSSTLAYINTYAGKGWQVSVKDSIVGQIPANELDKLEAADTLSAPADASADLWNLIQVLNQSALVTIERSTASFGQGVLPPSPWGTPSHTVSGNLVGGTEDLSPVLSDFEDALAAMKMLDLQVVSMLTGPGQTTPDLGVALVNHCIDAAVAGKERNGYIGTQANLSLDDLYTDWVCAINSRHVSVVAQKILRTNPLTGALAELDPPAFAVLAAAMQCGRNIGIPLTNKKPNVRGTKQTWTLGVDDNDVIAKGLYAITTGDTGYVILRSITSYVTDDNPAYAEVSANESGNYSIRDVRAKLKQKIGDPALIPVKTMQGLVQAILDDQVKGGFIQEWKAGSVLVQKVADKYSIDYDFVPVFPFNFAIVHAHALAN